jgi:hypothetical protein
VQRTYFNLGESRHVKLLIKSANKEAFVIRTAKWELLKKGVLESQGDCSIDEHIIDAYISPLNTGTYKLRFTYEIADETIIEVIEVVVV